MWTSSFSLSHNDSSLFGGWLLMKAELERNNLKQGPVEQLEAVCVRTYASLSGGLVLFQMLPCSRFPVILLMGEDSQGGLQK